MTDTYISEKGSANILGDEDGFTLVGSLPIPKLVYNQPDSSWVVFSKPSHCYPSGMLGGYFIIFWINLNICFHIRGSFVS